MPKQSAVNNDEHGTVFFLVWKMQPKKERKEMNQPEWLQQNLNL